MRNIKKIEISIIQACIFIAFLSKKDLGGSVILDLGIYVLQLAQYIFKDEPIKVIASGEVNEEGVDLVDTIVLEYENDRRAVLNVNAKLRLWNKATVYGTKGRITVSLFSQPSAKVNALKGQLKYLIHRYFFILIIKSF